MENIYIQTSQNIHLEQSVASIGERILAQLIDYLLFAAYGLIAKYIDMILVGIFHINSMVLPILLTLPCLFYDLFCEFFFNGQNVGKRIMKLKVVTVNGSQPEVMSYFIRWMFRIIDTVMSLGGVATFTIIFNGKGQRLGDIAAGTRVIRLKPVIHSDLFTNQQLPVNYQPVFREAENLTDNDYRILREIFESRMSDSETVFVNHLMENAKKQYCLKLNISTQLSAKNFLNTLEKDFVYYHSEKYKNQEKFTSH
jgi:uncharacterized RDD family membrane protein YckC